MALNKNRDQINFLENLIFKIITINDRALMGRIIIWSSGGLDINARSRHIGVIESRLCMRGTFCGSSRRQWSI